MEKTEAIFKELSPLELLSVNGGDPIGTLLKRISPWFAAVSLALYLYDNLDEFVEGVKEGYASTQDK